MTVPKHLLTRTVLLDVESTYGGGPAAALDPATDAFLTVEDFEPKAEHLDDGAIQGTPPGGADSFGRVEASGRASRLSLVHLAKGPGAVYSGSNVATIDRILKAAAYARTDSGSPNTHVYTPQLEPSVSLGLDAYVRKQRHQLVGVYVTDIEIAADGPVVPRWTIGLAGIGTTLPSDAAVPAGVVYPNGTVRWPKAAGAIITLSAGGQTLSLRSRSFTFKSAREATAVAEQTTASGAHPGFMLGRPSTTLSLSGKALPLVGTPYVGAAALDPYQLFNRGLPVAVVIEWGGVANNTFRIDIPQAHLTAEPDEDSEGPVALWSLQLAASPSDPASVVTHTITAK